MTPLADRLAADFADRYRIERFVQGIKTTAAPGHPHLLPLFDSDEAGEFPPLRHALH